MNIGEIGEQTFQYTDEQKKAMQPEKGFLRITACAGSGKTEVISNKVANYIISKKAEPKNIVAFTFTVKAAEELKSRIRRILQEKCPERSDIGDMYIGTIDSFCFQTLQDLDPRYKSYDVLDSAKRVAFVSKTMNFFSKLELNRFRKRSSTKKQLTYYHTLNRFLDTVDLVMMEKIPIEDINDEEFVDSYNRYCELLEKEKYFDFPSMTRKLLDMIETDDEFRTKFQTKFKYLIVDEYQDVNKIQELLVEAIAKNAEAVCVVGDDDQCIYSWRGSKIGNIIDFDKNYDILSKENFDKPVSDIPLDINFRSTEGIVHTAAEFIKNNKHRSKKEMRPSGDSKRVYESGDIIWTQLEKQTDEFEYISNKITSLNGIDYLDKRGNAYALSLGDFAVLVRTNDTAAKIVDFLEGKGIACIAYSGGTIFERPEVVFAMDSIAYAFGCKGYNFSEPDLKTLTSRYKNLFNKKEYPLADSKMFSERILNIKSEIDKIKDKEKPYLSELGLQGIYLKILNAFGADVFNFSEPFHYNFAVLSQAISDYESVWIRLKTDEITGFFAFCKAYGESKYVDTKNADPTRINAVKVMTIHKSKGLEFPVVFIPEMVNKKKKNPTPYFIEDHLYDKKAYNDNEEENRRIVYTAITRSQKYLFITGYRTKPGKKTPYEPSPFVDEMDKKYILNDIAIERSKSNLSSKGFEDSVISTSFSELTTYDRCPKDYLLRHVYGYNAGVPPAFGYGTNIHNILNYVHNRYLTDGKVLSNQEIDEITEKMFNLRYATEKMQENMKKGALKVIKNYVDLQNEEFRKILETEKHFEFSLGLALITGQIDLIKKLDENGNVSEVEIIDFKTESNSKNDVYVLDYHKQLRLYALACLKSLGLSPEKAYIHHLDVLGVNRKEEVNISPEVLEHTKGEIVSSIDDIFNKNFSPKPCGNCELCDYNHICCDKLKD
ncbi:DNA helicase-2/ATP-dependent DNA helicase PcrA [Methanococcus maripaludis]|uniref:DNA 3'-5' helicase n=1 Tax=Methanococcus maripaludis TaxID=39152 RepID=A0A7J9P1M8_METMI|nr:ATP-dependent DNA helicase [Methanococcus maripaludis]MBA2853477.1 DNA helicase-2/ATP-dependent DNA helicase PcrA [Methanococcus maripaludis]